MDVLRNLDTHNYVLKGFESVSYRIYVATKQHKAQSNISLQELIRIDILLRETNLLYHVDCARRFIWLFDTRAQDQWTDDFDSDNARQELQEYAFSIESQGLFLAKDLGYHGQRPAASSVAPGQVTRPEPNAATAGNEVKSAGVDIDTHGSTTSAKAVYSALICAFFSKAFRGLDSLPSVIPMTNGLYAVSTSDSQSCYQSFGMRIYLTTHGHVVHASYMRPGVFLSRLECDHQSMIPGLSAPIRILPFNLSAELDLNQPDGIHSMQSDKHWKELVTLWLRARGIALPGIERPDAWSRVLLVDRNAVSSRSIPTRDQIDDQSPGHAILWPARLCLIADHSGYASNMVTMAQKIAPSGPTFSSWFQNPADGGYEDPFVAVQAWAQGKPSRDHILKQLTTSKMLEDEARRLEVVDPGPVSSPIASRNTYELQAVAGMYPTPPDGMISMAGVPSIDAIAASTPLQPRFEDRHNSDGFQTGINFDQSSAQIPPHSAVEDEFGPDADLHDEKDDLFDFADEEETTGNGITDADFNFFDEADDELMEPSVMSSPTAQHAVNPVPPAIDSETAKDLPVSDDLGMASDDSAGLVARVKSPESLTHIEQDGVPEVQPEILDVQSPNRTSSNTRAPRSPQSLRQALHMQQHAGLDQSDRADEENRFAAVMFPHDLRSGDASYVRHDSKHMAGQLSQSSYQEDHASRPYLSELVQSALSRNESSLKRKASVIDYDNDASSTSHSTTYENSLIEVSDDHSFPQMDEDEVEAMSVDHEESKEVSTSVSRGQWPVVKRFMALINSQTGELGAFFDDGDISPKDPASATGSNNQRSRALDTSNRVSSLPASPISLDLQKNPRFSERNYIIVAQLVAEHIASSTLDLLNNTPEPLGMPVTATALYHGIQKGHASIGHPLTNDSTIPERRDLLAFAAIQDIAHEQSLAARLQPRQINRKAPPHPLDNSGPVAVCLPSPHIRVKRTDGIWDLLPSALPFWEPLGLLPVQGAKNISAFCLFPDNQDLARQVTYFLDQLGNTYERCRLGDHRWAIRSDLVSDGLKPLKLTSPYSYSEAITALESACVSLGMQLASTDLKPYPKDRADTFRNGSVVVYVIDFLRTSRALRDICYAFCKLCHAYMSSGKPKLDIVLQVIPMQYVAADGVPVILDQLDLCKLAREVYGRCENSRLNSDTSRLRIPSPSAIQLEEVLMRKIDFKVTMDPPQDLLKENSNMHVAYATRSDSRWVTAAWTTNSGRYDATTSYSLTGGRKFAEIAREIWQTTLDIISVRKVQWRICIARAGVMEKEEAEAWISLAAGPSPLPVITLLTSVDPEPPLELRLKTTHISDLTLNPSTMSANTPAATPQPGVSPDPTSVATPATPSAADPQVDALSGDPDAHLVELADETWAIILGHRVNISPDCREYRPSMSTGLLIRTAEAAHDANARELATTESALPYAAVHLLWVGSSVRNSGPAQQQHQIAISPVAVPPQVALGLSTGESGMQGQTGTGAASPATYSPAPQSAGLGNLPKMTSDGILKEYMQLYRNLAVLAKVRGLRDTNGGCLPWHIVMVLRAIAGLDAAMGHCDDL